MAAEAFAPGDPVVWRHEMRGGYGYVEHIDAAVAKVGPKRVRIEAPLKRGGTKLVWVDPKNLRAKASPEGVKS